MNHGATPILHGTRLFRKDVQVYVNRSDESFQDYMGVMHRHDFIEIAYVISGNGLHQVGEAQYRTGAGDLFIVNHDVPHGFFTGTEEIKDANAGSAKDGLDIESDTAKGGPAFESGTAKGALNANSGTTNDARRLIVYNCVFTPAFLDVSLLGAEHFSDITSSYLFRSLFPESGAPEADLHLSGTDYREFGTLFASMYKEYKDEKKGYPDIIRALLITLLIKMFRLMEDNRTVESSPHPASEFHRQLVDRAIAYMQEHATSALRLEDVAMQSFVSKNHFSRLFREVTGTKFSDHLQKLRIDEAIHLLSTTEDKVTDIALSCGFHDIKHFYATFRKQTGKTPGLYRKNR